MEAVRKVINAEVLSAVVDMPGGMRQGQVEIIVFPFSQTLPNEMTGAKKSALFPNLALDMKGCTFDRQEANER
jgi:hypothetical protein